MNPEKEAIYAGIAGVQLEPDSFDLGAIISIWGVLCILLGGIIYVYSRPPAPKPEPPNIKATWTGVIFGINPISAPIWLVESSPRGQTRRPVRSIIWVKFTNLKSAPIMIDSYSIQGKNKLDNPKEIDIRFGQLYLAPTSLKQAALVDSTGNAFNSVIRDRNLYPSQTVQGLMVFENIIDPYLTMKVNDTLGNEYVISFDEDLKGEGNSGENIQKIQQAGIKLMPGFRDISEIPLVEASTK